MLNDTNSVLKINKIIKNINELEANDNGDYTFNLIESKEILIKIKNKISQKYYDKKIKNVIHDIFNK